MSGALPLRCTHCDGESAAKLLYYGERPVWFCSPLCENLWVLANVPRRLIGLVEGDALGGYENGDEC